MHNREAAEQGKTWLNLRMVYVERKLREIEGEEEDKLWFGSKGAQPIYRQSMGVLKKPTFISIGGVRQPLA